MPSIEELMKEEKLEPFKFGIEHKTYKDTFEVRKSQSKDFGKSGNLKGTKKKSN
jgi:hypothetical protein